MLGRTPAISPMLAIVAIALFASLGYQAFSRFGRPPVSTPGGGPIVALACLVAVVAAAALLAVRSRDGLRVY